METPNKVKEIVKESYAKIAQSSGGCGCGSCGCDSEQTVQKQSGQMGYSPDEMKQVPVGSNLGLGCGNPVAIASLKEGEIVLDLGSGAGFDAFLAQSWLVVEGRNILLSLWTWYKKGSHFVDSYLLSWAKNNNSSIVSFDKKLTRKLN